MAFGLGLLFKLLGWGKMLLGLIRDIIKGIIKFAIEKPFQFLTVALFIALLFTIWWANGIHKDLVETRKIIETKTKFIKEQNIVLKQYVKTLEVEKKNHVADIQASNKAVANLKKTADDALARTQAEAKKVAVKQAQYRDLAVKYATSNPSDGTAEVRIKREEQTTDQFIDDWKKAK